jgi:hypothetical protein
MKVLTQDDTHDVFVIAAEVVGGAILILSGMVLFKVLDKDIYSTVVTQTLIPLFDTLVAAKVGFAVGARLADSIRQ